MKNDEKRKKNHRGKIHLESRGNTCCPGFMSAHGMGCAVWNPHGQIWDYDKFLRNDGADGANRGGTKKGRVGQAR